MQHLRVTQALHLKFKRFDGRDQGHDALDVALVLGADEPGHNPVEDFFYAHAFLCRLPLCGNCLHAFPLFPSGRGALDGPQCNRSSPAATGLLPIDTRPTSHFILFAARRAKSLSPRRWMGTRYPSTSNAAANLLRQAAQAIIVNVPSNRAQPRGRDPSGARQCATLEVEPWAEAVRELGEGDECRQVQCRVKRVWPKERRFLA